MKLDSTQPTPFLGIYSFGRGWGEALSPPLGEMKGALIPSLGGAGGGSFPF